MRLLSPLGPQGWEGRSQGEPCRWLLLAARGVPPSWLPLRDGCLCQAACRSCLGASRFVGLSFVHDDQVQTGRCLGGFWRVQLGSPSVLTCTCQSPPSGQRVEGQALCPPPRLGTLAGSCASLLLLLGRACSGRGPRKAPGGLSLDRRWLLGLHKEALTPEEAAGLGPHCTALGQPGAPPPRPSGSRPGSPRPVGCCLDGSKQSWECGGKNFCEQKPVLLPFVVWWGFFWVCVCGDPEMGSWDVLEAYVVSALSAGKVTQSPLPFSPSSCMAVFHATHVWNFSLGAVIGRGLQHSPPVTRVLSLHA